MHVATNKQISLRRQVLMYVTQASQLSQELVIQTFLGGFNIKMFLSIL